MIIIVIIISIFKEDNIFSITASLPYGPPMIQTLIIIGPFIGLVYFCNCCKVSYAIYMLREEKPVLAYNAEHQARSPLVPFLTPLVWPGPDQSYISDIYSPKTIIWVLPFCMSPCPETSPAKCNQAIL